MELIHSLEAFIAAQKTVGFNFILLGISLIILSGFPWRLMPILMVQPPNMPTILEK